MTDLLTWAALGLAVLAVLMLATEPDPPRDDETGDRHTEYMRGRRQRQREGQ